MVEVGDVDPDTFEPRFCGEGDDLEGYGNGVSAFGGCVYDAKYKRSA